MISTSSTLLVFILLTPFSVRAANDWSVPCVKGGCSWDTGDGKTTAYSSMAIGGNKNLISDITPAAGWSISGCDPNWKDGTHTIQMTCTDPSDETGHCGHLYEGGAEHTIVRLPENCGTGPFARVVSATNNTGSISRRAENSSSTDGTHTLTLDYNFHQVPTSRGKIAFAVTATNMEGIPGVSKRDLDALRGRGRARGLHRKRFAHLRGFRRGFGDIIGSAEDAAKDAADAAEDAANAVTSAAGSAASAVSSAISNANSFDKTLSSGKITPISFNQDVVLFDKSISCKTGDFSANAEFKVDVDGKVDFTVEFGVTLVGTIVPPKLDDFSVTSDLGGTTSATFTIDAKAEGKFDTTPIPLFKFGFPGLSIPSIITLGPEFSISAQVIVDLKAEAKLAVQAAWEFPTIKLVFPPEKGASSGDATVTNTNNPLTLSAAPSTDVSASISAHIIPRVDFGIDIFGGAEQASIFVNADISATLTADAFAKAAVDNKPVTTSAAANATSIASNATQTDIGAPIQISAIANATTTAIASATPIASIIGGPISISQNQPSVGTSVITRATSVPSSTAVSSALGVANSSSAASVPAIPSSSPIGSLSVVISSISTASASAVASASRSAPGVIVTSATVISTSAGASQSAVASTSANASQTGKPSNTIGISTASSSQSVATSKSANASQPGKVSSTIVISAASSSQSVATSTAANASQTGKASNTNGMSAASSSQSSKLSSGSSTGTRATSTGSHASVASSTASGTKSSISVTGSTVGAAPSGTDIIVSTASGGEVITASTIRTVASGTVSVAVPTMVRTTDNTVPVVVSTIVTTAVNGASTTISTTLTVASATGIATPPANSAASTTDLSTGAVLIETPIVTGVAIGTDSGAASATLPIVTGVVSATTVGSASVNSIGRNGSPSVGPQAPGSVTKPNPVAIATGSIPTFSAIAGNPTKYQNSTTRPALRCRPQKSGLYSRGAKHKALTRRATSASSNGCITLSAGIAINAGLTGSLEPFIDKKEVSFKIFSKDIQLFQKCLKDPPPAAKRRRNLPNNRRDDAGLQCPIGGIVSVLESLI